METQEKPTDALAAAMLRVRDEVRDAMGATQWNHTVNEVGGLLAIYEATQQSKTAARAAAQFARESGTTGMSKSILMAVGIHLDITRATEAGGRKS